MLDQSTAYQAAPAGASETGKMPSWSLAGLQTVLDVGVSTGSIIVEIDRLETGLGWMQPDRSTPGHMQLFVHSYLREIGHLGLWLNRRWREKLDKCVVVGPQSSDVFVESTLFARHPQIKTRVRVRTIDDILDGVSRVGCLILGEYATDLAMLRGAEQTLRHHQPVVVLRSAASEMELAKIMAWLRVQGDYDWISPPHSHASVAASIPGHSERIQIAIPANGRDRLTEHLELEDRMAGRVLPSIPHDALQRTRSPAFHGLRFLSRGSVANIELGVDDFIAVRGMYEVESHDTKTWRWCGSAEDIGIFLEVPEPAHYSIGIQVPFAVQGALGCMVAILVNGRPVNFDVPSAAPATILFSAYVPRHAAICLGCSRRVHPDSRDLRTLNVAIESIRIAKL